MVRTPWFRPARIATVVVVLTSLFYPPTVGIGEEGAPDVAVQGALVAVAAVAGLAALSSTDVRRLTVRVPAVFASMTCVLMVLTAVQSSQPFDGIARGVWFGSVGLVLMWLVVGEDRWADVLVVLCVPIAVFAVASVAAYPFADVEFQGGGEFFNERLFPWPRLRGLAVNHTVLGVAGAGLIVTAVGVGQSLRRSTSIAFAAIGVLSLLASHSRAALGAVAVAVVLEVARSRREYLVPVVAAGAAIVGLGLLAGGGANTLDRSDEQEAIGQSGELGVLTGRGDVWNEAWNFGLERPMTGHGVGEFAALTGEQFEAGHRLWDPVHAHNVALELFTDQGLLGLANLLVLIVAVVVLRHRIPAGGLGLFVAVGLHSVVEGLLYGAPHTGWMFVVVVVAWMARSESAVGVAEPTIYLDRPETDHHPYDHPVGG
jgi:O-antigen ligase